MLKKEKNADKIPITVYVTKKQRERKETLETSWAGAIEAGLRALEGIGK